MPKGRRREAKAAVAEAETALAEMPQTGGIVQPHAVGRTLGALNDLKPKQRAFLRAFCTVGTVSKAAELAGIHRNMHYEWMQYPAYEAAYNEARKVFGDYLENTALELATGVHFRPIASAGKVVAYERIFDSKLLMRMMGAKKPEEYGNKVDITSQGQSIVKLIDRETWDAV